jgi:hypothetical protein
MTALNLRPIFCRSTLDRGRGCIDMRSRSFLMVSLLFFSMVLALIHPAAVGAQNAANRPSTPILPETPAIPRETEESERILLTRSAYMISQKQFSQAETLLKPIMPVSSPQVYVNTAAVPKERLAGCRKAVQEALDAWNKALTGKAQFRLAKREEDADLALEFALDVAQNANGEYTRLCADSRLERQNGDGTRLLTRRLVKARISLSTPKPGGVHSVASLTHLTGQALGHYLGLGDSSNATDIMGPDTHDVKVSRTPSTADLSRVRAISLSRATLLKFAQQQTAAHMSHAILETEKSTVNIGDVWRGDLAHFTFTIKNPGDAPLEITAKPNCGCTVANYDKVIAPGGQGKIEADIRTATFKGRIVKVITVSSNDPGKLQTNLNLLANVRPIVEVTPLVGIIFLKSDVPTVREFHIKVRGPEPAEITRVACFSPFATAALEPESGENGETAYKLTLTVKPEAPLGRSSVQVTAFTSSKREPQVSLSQMCEKGIVAMPVGIYLGALTPNTPMPVQQRVLLTRRDGAFHIQKVESADPKLEVSQETLQDGTQYRLTLTYRGGWAEGPIQRKVIVQTDDPLQPKIEIGVLATMLPAAPAQKP